MSVDWGKSVSVWIFGFLAFIAGLNTLNATIIWATRGINASVELYIIGDLVSSWRFIDVTAYFWTSLIATFILLGITIIQALREPRFGLQVARMASKVEDEMVTTRGTLDATRVSLIAKMEDEKIARQDMFADLNENMDGFAKEMMDELKKQRSATEKTSKDLEETAMELGRLRKDVADTLNRHIKVVQSIERSSKRTRSTAERNMKELASLRPRMEKLETELILPKPELASASRTEELKGVGPRLAEELKAMGITNIGEFLLTDPKSVGAKTRATPEMAARLQSRAQLLMIPSIDDNDADMLVDSGITSRTRLAAQDAITLGRRIDRVAKAYIAEKKISEAEKPTIEEISTWIRLAKL